MAEVDVANRGRIGRGLCVDGLAFYRHIRISDTQVVHCASHVAQRIF